MSWIVAILSVFLVLACLLLILLVLIQLPKKEAGMGQAFGGGTTDALFGAGSGTALTKMTKYTTGIFLFLTVLLWVLKAQDVKHLSNMEERLKQMEKTERPAASAAPNAPKTAPAAPASGATDAVTNAAPLLLSGSTNAIKAPTNAPAAEAPKAK